MRIVVRRKRRRPAEAEAETEHSVAKPQQSQVSFEFDGDAEEPASAAVDTTAKWSVQNRGQILYDYEGESSSSRAQVVSSRLPGSESAKAAYKKRQNLTATGEVPDRYQRKKPKLSITGTHEAAEANYEHKLIRYLKQVGGEASASAIGNFVKKPKEFGPKFKMALFLQLRPKLFHFDHKRRWVRLAEGADAEEGEGD